MLYATLAQQMSMQTVKDAQVQQHVLSAQLDLLVLFVILVQLGILQRQFVTTASQATIWMLQGIALFAQQLVLSA